MANAPFLSRIPAKYLQDVEERKFWEYLISYLDKSTDGDGAAAAIQQANESEVSSFIATLTTEDGTTSTIDGGISEAREAFLTRNNQITVNGGIHYAVDGDYITGINGPQIILPDNPSNNDSIRYTHGDTSITTIISNNKNIVDTRAIQITLKDSSYTLLYTVGNDYWSVL